MFPFCRGGGGVEPGGGALPGFSGAKNTGKCRFSGYEDTKLERKERPDIYTRRRFTRLYAASGLYRIRAHIHAFTLHPSPSLSRLLRWWLLKSSSLVLLFSSTISTSSRQHPLFSFLFSSFLPPPSPSSSLSLPSSLSLSLSIKLYPPPLPPPRSPRIPWPILSLNRIPPSLPRPPSTSTLQQARDSPSRVP